MNLNFAAAAQETVNIHWLAHDPMTIATGVLLLGFGSYVARAKYKEHKANRARVDAIMSRLPDVEPVKLPTRDNLVSIGSSKPKSTWTGYDHPGLDN